MPKKAEKPALSEAPDADSIRAQKPNFTAWVWLIALITYVSSSFETVQTIAYGVGTIFLGIWALQEIFTGVNSFRKRLGMAGLGLAILLALAYIPFG